MVFHFAVKCLSISWWFYLTKVSNFHFNLTWEIVGNKKKQSVEQKAYLFAVCVWVWLVCFIAYNSVKLLQHILWVNFTNVCKLGFISFIKWVKTLLTNLHTPVCRQSNAEIMKDITIQINWESPLLWNAYTFSSNLKMSRFRCHSILLSVI